MAAIYPQTGSGTETDPVYVAGGATDVELAAAIDTVNTALAAKQASATAATDAELADAVAALEATLATKQDSSSAATDAEVTAAIAAHVAGDATDAELQAAVDSLTASLALKQDAATAATDTELSTGLAGKQDVLAGTVDTVDSLILLMPSEDDQNALTIKSPNDTWGDEGTVPYGKGQAIQVMREDYEGTPAGGGTETEPDRNVLFRVDRRGGVGAAGGMHLATGFRQRGNFAGTVALWIQNIADVVGLVIQAASNTPTADYVQVKTQSGTMRLQVRPDGKVLYDVPQVSLGNSGGQSTTSGSGLDLTFDTERFDTDGMHSTGSNTDRITCVTAGVYVVTANVSFNANATGTRQVSINHYDSGGSLIRTPGFDKRNAATAGATQLSVGCQVKMAAGEFLRLTALQDSGGSITVSNGVGFSASYIGRGN